MAAETLVYIAPPFHSRSISMTAETPLKLFNNCLFFLKGREEERQRQTEISHWQVHSLDASNNEGWVKLEPGVGNSVWSPTRQAGTQVLEPLPEASRGHISWNGERRQDSNQRILIWQLNCCPTGSFLFTSVS